jgi:hypothetical protein
MPKQINFLIAFNILSWIFVSCAYSPEKASQEIKNLCQSAPYQVWVSYSNECPLCIRYTQTFRQIRDSLPSNWKFRFLKIHSNEFWDFDWSVPLSEEVLNDTALACVRYAQMNVYPEAIIIDSAANIHYRGAIDDRAIQTGISKITRQKNYLAEAIQSISNKKEPSKPFPHAHGCFIESEK